MLLLELHCGVQLLCYMEEAEEQHKALISRRANCVVIILGLLTIAHHPSSAWGQQSVSHYVYGLCNTGQFSSNDTFAHNFNGVVASLTQQASKSLYASAKSETGSSNDSYAYGIYQCRGDVSLSDCSSCISNGLLVNRVCGSGKGARVQYQGCFIRYEAYNFLGAADNNLAIQPICSSAQDSTSLYQRNLATALNNTASAAPQHALFGYNATSMGTGSNTVFALAQCLGYISPSQCDNCLSQVSTDNTVCNDSVSGEVYFNTCFYTFNHTSFLFNTSTSTSTPPAATPPSTIPTSPAPSPNISSVPIISPPPPPTASNQGNSKKKNSIPAIVGTAVGISLLALIAALVLCFTKRRKKAARSKPQGTYVADQLPYNLPQPGATRFLLEELQEATDDFHPRNKLGEGGFGSVYQGRLKTGREVAIKMLSAGSRQGKTEFMNEVNLITTVQHRNLIQLIGCCVEESKRLLVYEFLSNRSLDLHLFDVGEDNVLDWRTRFEIIVGISRGLTYLHEDSHVRIIHRDIKASNILLDNNLTPKIADFGLARFFADEITHLTTRVAGTMGYLAPEYAMNGQLTEKVDVYGFGMVALEIVSGRKVMEYSLGVDKQNLLEWTWALYERQQQMHIVDERLAKRGMNRNMRVNVGEVVRVVHVALLCTQSRPQARPSMSQVYTMLCGQSEILELPTKPITIDMFSPNNAAHGSTFSMPSTGSELSQPASVSISDEPLSQVEPR